jgi:hypothetical protein
MYHYQKKLQEEVAKFQPKKAETTPVAPTPASVLAKEDREVTIDEMLQTLSDRNPEIVIPVSEFFGWFKKSATPNEQLLLTSFSSIVLPRLAAKINQNSNNPDKVLSILKTECTQKEKDLITKLAGEIIPALSKRYALGKIESAQLSGSAYYYQKKLHEEVKRSLTEKIFGFGSRKAPPKMPEFYTRPPQGWKASTIEDPSGPGIPAIEKIIPGIGTIVVMYSEGGIKKTFGGFRQTWSIYGDLSFIPDALCKKANVCSGGDSGDESTVNRAFINLRDWHEIVKGFTQAHSLVMKGRV